MDPMINQIVTKYNMKHWWGRRHVNQAIVRHLKDSPILSSVLSWIMDIRSSLSEKEALEKIEKLKKILTTQQTKGIKNSLCDVDIWNYLNTTFFTHLDKMCRWTVQHLPSDFWEWFQAIESRNNKDLNIWNAGQTGLSIEECILRFHEIDKADIRQAYLNYLEANVAVLQQAVKAKKKNPQRKFITAVVRENWDLHFANAVKVDDITGDSATFNSDLDVVINNIIPNETERGEIITLNISTEDKLAKFDTNEKSSEELEGNELKLDLICLQKC